METPESSEAVRAHRAKVFEEVSFPVQLMNLPHPLSATEGETIPGRQAVIRTDTREVLNIVSKKYPLVPHIDVFGSMDEAIERLGVPVLDRDITTAYSGGYAKCVWTLDREMFITDPQFKDSLKVTLHARNSYNYSSLVGLELGTLRQICTNGAMAGKLLASARKRHVPSINIPSLIKDISAVIESTEKLTRMFDRWNTIEYPRNRFSEWLGRKPLSKKGRADILNYFDAQPDRVRAGGTPSFTGWEAFNALTWYGTHRVTSRRADTILLAEEKVLELAEIFSREELEGKAARSQN